MASSGWSTPGTSNQVERINLERELVKALSAGCRTVVAGYTVKREYFNSEFSAGVENIGYDALDGFSSRSFCAR